MSVVPHLDWQRCYSIEATYLEAVRQGIWEEMERNR